MLTEREAEQFRIRQLVEMWALTRDAGDWDGFASVWHSGGWMTATWFQGRPPTACSPRPDRAEPGPGRRADPGQTSTVVPGATREKLSSFPHIGRKLSSTMRPTSPNRASWITYPRCGATSRA